MLRGGAQWYMQGDPGKFGRWWKGVKKRTTLKGFRRNLGAFSGFIPGGSALSALGVIGDPGRSTVKRAGKPKHAVHKAHRLSFGAALSAARKFAGSHPGLTSFGQSVLGSVPIVGGAASNLTEQILGGGGPSLEDASAATGLPASHPHTRALHRMMGGRHRRQNVTNIHALRKAERRLSGFVKLYRKVARNLGYSLHHGHTARVMRKRRK